MRNQKLKVLIVDDHPIVVLAYTKALNLISKKNERLLEMKLATNLKEAKELLGDKSYIHTLDFLFLDMRLSGGNGKLGGLEIGLMGLKRRPDLPIVVITMIRDNYLLLRILKVLNPVGLFLKDSLTATNLLINLDHIINYKLYYGRPILQILRTYISLQDKIDDLDRRMLYEISNGYKTKDLPGRINISLSNVEQRKRNLKKNLGLHASAEDSQLIAAARSKVII